MIDYLIVGFGLAGLAFSEQLRTANKTFTVIDQQTHSSSKVAGGMYNPVILKRFTLPWQSTEQLKTALPFYQALEKTFNNNFLIPLPVHRIFHNIEEQNNWLIASDKPQLTNYLNTQFINNKNPHINAPYQFGQVDQAGRLLVGKLLDHYIDYLLNNNQFITAAFDHTSLNINPDHIEYKGIKAKKIIFTEGFGMKSNPLFNYLPLNGTKGEVLIIKAEKLQLKTIVKSGVFIIPQLNTHHYFIGATYNNYDKTWDTTSSGRDFLLEKLNTILTCDYEVIDHLAGIRPTVKDRRPLVGSHPEHNHVLILNGLGTRGVMVAPLTAETLYNHVEKGTELPSEISIRRFDAMYPS